MRALLLLLSFAPFSPAAAQTGVETLLERLESPRQASPAQCARQIAQAAKLNGPDLLHGAAVCYAAKRHEEGNFLLNAGQVRSSADMVLMVPASKADSDVQASLYGVIYLHSGGPGREDVLRDSSARDRFFKLFDGWAPDYGPDYKPGWNVGRRPDPAAYRAAIAELKAGRREQLADISRLYSDEEYYSLHRRLQDLIVRNGNSVAEGTPDAKLWSDLQRKMNERSAALGISPHPADEAGDPGSEPFPPDSPALEETVLAGSADPVVQRCADLAERSAIAAESSILRVLITKSPEWGVIWRADLGGGGQPVERITCTENSSASRPLDMGDERIAPLPERLARPGIAR